MSLSKDKIIKKIIRLIFTDEYANMLIEKLDKSKEKRAKRNEMIRDIVFGTIGIILVSILVYMRF